MCRAFSTAVLGQSLPCQKDKLFLVFRIILMRVRKTVAMPAWPSKFNIPFFHFPVCNLKNHCRFNGGIIIKNKYEPT